jgi:hypothetical protein
MHRSIRRAGIPVAYTKGFHPTPRIAFSQPIPLGMESISEEMAMVTLRHLNPVEIKDVLNRELPLDMEIRECIPCSNKPGLGPEDTQHFLVIMRDVSATDANGALECMQVPGAEAGMIRLSLVYPDELEDSTERFWVQRAVRELSSRDPLLEICPSPYV